MTLALIIALAFSVEAALGFGATLVAVALGALVMPIEELLPALVPLNVAMSLSIAVRNRDAIAWSTLTKDIAPRMLVGLPLGLFVFRAVSSTHLRVGLGGLVVALAVAHFARARAAAAAGSEAFAAHRGLGGRRATSADASVRSVLLVLAGVVHGALGTGGPLVVAALAHPGARGARDVHGAHGGPHGPHAAHGALEKRAFRATLAMLWLALNVVLGVGFALEGRYDATLFMHIALGAIGALVGAFVGEIAFRRIPAARFETLVWCALLVCGGLLLAR